MVPGIEQGTKTARPEGRGCPARSVTQIEERKYRRPTCPAGVPNTLTHRSPDLADDLGESQVWTVPEECSLVYLSVTACHHITCQEVTVSCDSIPAPSHQCHLHGSLVSYITLLPPYSHCVSRLPYHSITKSHSPCISVATSHCHHCLSGVLQVQLIAAENKTSRGVIHSQ